MRPFALTWRYVGGFGPEHLKLMQEQLPRLAAGQVLVEMRAASFNYRDLAVLDGRMGSKVTPPLIPLSDGAGIVTALGASVSAVSVGQRVTPSFFQNWSSGSPPQDLTNGRLGGPLDGVLSTHRVFSAEALVAAPAHLSDIEAAALPCAGVTAWCALTEPRPIERGKSVLIHGSGGVALFALVLGKAMGVHCVVTTSTEAKAVLLKQLGADEVILRGGPDWPRRATGANKGKFHRVLELGGAQTLNGSVRCVRTGGLVLLIGNVTGSLAELDLAPVLTRRLTLASLSCGSIQAHRDFVAFMADHQLHPVIDTVFAFEDALAALKALRAGNHFGKLCIEIGEHPVAKPD